MIKWYSYEDIKKDFNKFRPFYKNIVDNFKIILNVKLANTSLPSFDFLINLSTTSFVTVNGNSTFSVSSLLNNDEPSFISL